MHATVMFGRAKNPQCESYVKAERCQSDRLGRDYINETGCARA